MTAAQLESFDPVNGQGIILSHSGLMQVATFAHLVESLNIRADIEVKVSNLGIDLKAESGGITISVRIEPRRLLA